MKKIYGIVNKVTYYNEENGFGVIRIKLDYHDPEMAKSQSILVSNNLVVTSNFSRIPIEGEEYIFYGDFVNTNYGIQFKAKSYSHQIQSSKNSIISFLASDLFKGIGKKTATKIYETLGPNCLQQIIDNKEVLHNIDGLKEQQKETIYQVLRDTYQTNQALMELLNFGLTMNMSIKIIKILKEKTLQIIRENPYQLIDLVEGIGFLRADQIALKIGISKNSPIRIQALIVYYLRMFTYANGNTYLEKEELYSKLCNLVNKDEDILTYELFLENIEILSKNKQIIIDEDKHIYDKYAYYAEKTFSEKVYQLLSADLNPDFNEESINSAFKKVQEESPITYSPNQIKAILTALRENISIITGGPGTGKSTVIKAIIETIFVLDKSQKYRNNIALLAPTGRAAKRLQEVTNYQAMTIHKFLGYDRSGRFRHGPDFPVDAKIVIVDESSMIDILLASRLFSALLLGTKVIFVGDANQLPSIGPGQVLLDLINSKEITTITLDTIHRQAENSSIVHLAHAINQGMIPKNILEKQEDRNFIIVNDQKIITNIATVIKQGLNVGLDLIRDIQVLVPLYKGEIGIDAINAYLQNELNPLVGDFEISHLGRKFRVNDKVIQLVNRSEKQVMNGDIGYIISLDYNDGKYRGLEVMFDFGPVYYDISELEDLSLAYAISIHKSQGSEFDLVIMPFSFKYYIMLKRKLIYTGVTRAKKYLIMLGNLDALRVGITNIEEQRKSKLIQRIKKYFSGVYPISTEKIYQLDDDDDLMEKISPYDFLEN